MTFNVKDYTADQLDMMNLVGTLIPKTQKGKQRIKQYGASGKIMRVQSTIPAMPNKVGMWFAVTAGDPTYRWVGLDDKDFTIVVKPWSGSQDANTH